MGENFGVGSGRLTYIPGTPSTRHSLTPHHGVTSGQTLLRPTPHDEKISTLGPPQSDEKDVCIPTQKFGTGVPALPTIHTPN
jgi:hypothetical protein